MPWVAAVAGSQGPHFTEHLSPKVEFISSNIFPCTDHHLLWCLTHTTQHWYVPGMRITYSEYIWPLFLTTIPSLIKMKKKERERKKCWQSHGRHFQGRIPGCVQSLGNTICCSKGEDGPLPKEKQDDFECDYSPVTANPSGNNCIVLKAFQVKCFHIYHGKCRVSSGYLFADLG